MLIVWDANMPRVPQPLSTIVAVRMRAEEHFTWPGPEGGDLAIGYVIVAPD